MSKIENQKGRRKNQGPSGYTRVFGNEDLGHLMSKVHAASIAAGTELEKIIIELLLDAGLFISDIDAFLNDCKNFDKRIYVSSKKEIKKSQRIKSQYEPDFIAFDLRKDICHIIEVKDGDQFDTKKASGELHNLMSYESTIARAIRFATKIHICSFHISSKEDFHKGLRGKFSLEDILTGKELCDLFDIDYNKILEIRKRDEASNLEFFIKELMQIEACKAIVSRL